MLDAETRFRGQVRSTSISGPVVSSVVVAFTLTADCCDANGPQLQQEQEQLSVALATQLQDEEESAAREREAMLERQTDLREKEERRRRERRNKARKRAEQGPGLLERLTTPVRRRRSNRVSRREEPESGQDSLYDSDYSDSDSSAENFS
jgi:hypothetical protein